MGSVQTHLSDKSSLFSTLYYILKKTQEAAAFPSFEDGNYLPFNFFFLISFSNTYDLTMRSFLYSRTVPGPCEPEDLIDGIIFAANYLGCTQVLSDKNPSKSVRMSQAHEAISHIKVTRHSQHLLVCFISILVSPRGLSCLFL